jgi:hypothetical protein
MKRRSARTNNRRNEEMMTKKKKIKLTHSAYSCNNNTPFTQDVLIEIIKYLPYQRIIHTMTLVNYYLNELTNTMEFWQQIFQLQPLIVDIEHHFSLQYEFIKRCQPARIRIHDFKNRDIDEDYPRAFQSVQLEKNFYSLLCLVEPFVTKLELPFEFLADHSSELIDEWPKDLKFPTLVSLKPAIFPNTLNALFGSDLTRFRSIELEGKDTRYQIGSSLQFGSLQTLKLCNESINSELLNLVTQNVNTLKNLNVSSLDNTDYREIFELLSLNIIYLTITLRSESLNSLVYSNLRTIVFKLCSPLQFTTFFSVTHPVLLSVSLSVLNIYNSDLLVMAPQPSVQQVELYGEMKSKLLKQLLDIFNPDKVRIIRYNEAKELNRFTRLESLTIDAVNDNSVADLLEENRNTLTTLRFFTNYNLNSIIYSLANIVHLRLYSLEKDEFSMIIKLLKVKYLHVTQQMNMSLSEFTELARTPSSLTDVFMGDIIEYNAKKPMYIIAPLEYLDIRCVWKIPDELLWLQIAISTMNVTRTNCTTSERHLSKLVDYLTNKKYGNLVTEMKKLLNTILKRKLVHIENDKELDLVQKMNLLIVDMLVTMQCVL